MKKSTQRRLTTAPLTATLAVALTLSTTPRAWADEYDDVCGGATSPTGQKASYCAAAQQSLDAEKRDKTLTVLYAAVAGTCVASCATEWTGIGAAGAYACQGGAVGASVADMVITKNFMNGFNLIAGGAGLAKAISSGGQEAPTEIGGTKFRASSCITAATTSLSAITHHMSASSDAASAESSLASAKQVNATNSNSYNLQNPGLTTSASTATQTGSAPSTGTNLASTGGSSSQSSNPCGDTSSVSGAVTCAATADQNLANQIGSSGFQDAFKKSSGMSLADYLKNASKLSPNDAIKASAGAALDPGTLSKLDGALAAIEKPGMYQGDQAPTYAAGGHGGGGGASDPDFGSIMSGLMSQLAPKNADDKKNGVKEVQFSGARRNLASVTAEDPTVSLFERVAFRYSSLTPRLLSEPQKQTLQGWKN
jgi:hypothetical protein